MEFEKLAYPEVFIFNGNEYEGRRDPLKNQVHIPYTDEPDIGIGDLVAQKVGKREILLKVLDISFLKGGTLEVGTKHPHMLTLIVENTSAKPHSSPSASTTYNIASLSGQQVQVGDGNVQIQNMTVKELVEYVAKSDDEAAKSTLKSLLSNSTVGSLIGAGASTLLSLLLGA